MNKMHRIFLYSLGFFVAAMFINLFVFKSFYPLVIIFESTFDFFYSLFWVYAAFVFVVYAFTISSKWDEFDTKGQLGLILTLLGLTFVFPRFVALTFSEGVTRFYVRHTASEPFTEEIQCLGGGRNKLFGLYNYIRDQRREKHEQYGLSDWCQQAYSPSHQGAYIQIEGYKNSVGRSITKVSLLPDDPNKVLFHGQEMSFINDFVQVGVREELRVLKYLDIKGPLGQRLALGHRVGVYKFLLGLHIKDFGPVIIPIGDDNRRNYYPISAEQIEAYQKEGILPTPLPTLNLSRSDYLFGYLAWFVAIFLFVYHQIEQKVTKYRQERRKKRPYQESEEERALRLALIAEEASKQLLLKEQERKRQKKLRRKIREAEQPTAKKRWFKSSD